MNFEPKPVDDVSMTFGDIKGMMPPREVLDAYKSGWGERLFSDWFYAGLKEMDLKPKDGIDATAAKRHIRTIMGSFEPKHEDKTAACGYLFELWFEPTSTWTRKEFIR